MHSFLISNSFPPLIKEAWKWVASLDSREILIVTPTLASADDFVRSPEALNSKVASFQRKTLLRLASEIAIPEMAERRVLPVTGLGVEALCNLTINNASRADQLTYFSEVADTPGMSRALAQTLLELRLQEVDFSRLEGIGESGKDLQRLGREYENYLEEDNLADSAMTYRFAIDRVQNKGIQGGTLPILFYHQRFNNLLETRFAAVLAQKASQVLILALESDIETIQSLSTVVKAKPHLVKDLNGGVLLKRIREHLFCPRIPPSSFSKEDSSFEFFSAPGESRECVEIARRVRMAVENGIRFDQVAVALRNPANYLPLLEDAFQRAKLPAYFSRGICRPNPAGRAFLALLECAREGLSAKRFAEYLSLAQVPTEANTDHALNDDGWVEPQSEQISFKTGLFSEGPERNPEALRLSNPENSRDLSGSLRVPEQWEQLLIDAAVIGGKDRWDRRLKGLENEVKLQIRQYGNDPLGKGSLLCQKLFLLSNLKSFSLPLIELLDQFPIRTSWNHWLLTLEELAVRSLKHPESVLSVLSELRPMGKVKSVGLEEVRRVLGERLTLLREQPPSNRYGCVTVAGISELWGRSFALVFLPGLAEGMFPRKAQEDPLFLDWQRGELDMLPLLPKRRSDERLLLRVAVAAASRRLVVSYPRIEVAQGRSRVPSFYALDILRAAEGKLPDLETLSKRAAEASSSRLGWPAPKDPVMAIDDTEFDLSMLHSMLRLGPKERLGRAHFLLEVNDHLKASLRTRARRWRRKFFSADGLVEPSPKAIEILEGESLSNRSYSSSSLQNYAVCPYKFFLSSIQRIRVRENPGALQQLDPKTRGALFHEVQFRFLAKLRRTGNLPITPASEGAALDELDKVFSTVSRSAQENLAPAIPRIWENEMEELSTDLRGWLKEMCSSKDDWLPSHFELAFGLSLDSSRDPDSRVEAVQILNGVKLRGSIDLVETRIKKDGRTIVRVTDHKTGSPRKQTPGRELAVGGGEMLQPLIYALAVEQLLDKEVEYGQLFYCTRRGEYQQQKVSIHAETRGKLKQVLEVVDRNIKKGFLPAAPRKDACRYCDFQPICGPYEEIRIQRKDKRLLVDLNELRELS